MMNRADFYQTHLDSVSRSFAFCIARLEGRPREYVGLAYLLCRVLDTIEDSPWKSLDDQIHAFHEFNRFLDQNTNPQERYKGWLAQFPKDISEGELALLSDVPVLIQHYHELPIDVKGVFFKILRSMSNGMQHFAHRREGGVLRLRSVRELNLYCFFVAGVIGELLTSIFHPQKQIDQEHLGDAFHFGLFLQKINVLKDQLTDEKEGRFLVPAREEVLSSLTIHVNRAVRYILSIPETNSSFRLFCAWSMGLAAASFPYIERSFREKRPLRLPRAEATSTLEAIEGALIGKSKDFEKRMQEIVGLFGDHRTTHPNLEGALPKYYEGSLSGSELRKLGLAELA